MDNNGKNGNGRIEALKEKERRIRAEIAAETVKRKKREFRDFERLKSIVGGEVLRYLDMLKDDIVGEPKEAKALEKTLKDLFQVATLAESDKKLLRSKAWL